MSGRPDSCASANWTLADRHLVESKGHLLSAQGSLDPLAGQAMVGTTQLICASLELIEDVLVEFDVELVCLRLLNADSGGRRLSGPEAVDDPRAGKGVIGERSRSCGPLDASQEE